MDKLFNISHRKLLSYLLLTDIILIIFSVLVPEDPKAYFKEFQLITWVSGLKLVFISYINWKTYGIREYKSEKNRSRLWLLISVGFLYLFLDEIALIHENIDKAIHFILRLTETSLTDRIDDVIVAVYAVIGIAVLRYFRDEILKFKNAIPYLVAGFILLSIRVVIDILTNRADIIPGIISDPELLLIVSDSLAVAEGLMKIAAESFFITAFYYCFTKASADKKNN